MKRAHDRLDLLATFVRIGESGSLSKAARVLGTTQPTASRRLLELERLLGCKLATRSTASFSLTDEGRSRLERIFKGSTASAVVQNARTSVLDVR